MLVARGRDGDESLHTGGQVIGALYANRISR